MKIIFLIAERFLRTGCEKKKILFLTVELPWLLDQGDKLRNYYLLRCQ